MVVHPLALHLLQPMFQFQLFLHPFEVVLLFVEVQRREVVEQRREVVEVERQVAVLVVREVVHLLVRCIRLKD